jgi:hypothetical protein
MSTGSGSSGRLVFRPMAVLSATILLAGCGKTPAQTNANTVSVVLQLPETQPPNPGRVSMLYVNS